jgi:hypothetical protein
MLGVARDEMDEHELAADGESREFRIVLATRRKDGKRLGDFTRVAPERLCRLRLCDCRKFGLLTVFLRNYQIDEVCQSWQNFFSTSPVSAPVAASSRRRRQPISVRSSAISNDDRSGHFEVWRRPRGAWRPSTNRTELTAFCDVLLTPSSEGFQKAHRSTPCISLACG